MFSETTHLERMSAREQEILSLIARGLSNREISLKLHISLDTVKWYNKQIFAKLGANSRTQAVSIANEMSLLQNEPVQRPADTSSLPRRLTSFVGRDREAQDIQALLEQSRLVTLTGPGGTGKTRLAVEVARAASSRYADGAHMVELAGVSEPWLVPNAIARALKISIQAGEQPLESVGRFLSRKQILLVMDNFEHILPAATYTVELLSSAPGLTILATSRERLNVSGEQEYPVEPLSLPDHNQDRTLDEVMKSEAVRLFLQRARGVRPGLVVGEKDAESLVRISLRLDGLPLALELAASQVKILPFEHLAERLAEDLSSLPEGQRDLPDRQRTLHSTIDWSYKLLSEPERALFENLAIFRGGGTLEAIERICAPGENVKTLTLLSGLVDKNLVRTREGEDGELRFYMLETIREYSCDLLFGGSRAGEVRKKHAQYFTELTEAAAKEFRTERQEYWLQRERAEQDNLRSVLAWSLSGEELEYGLRIVTALSIYWFYSGSSVEGERWIDLAMSKIEQAPAPLQAAMYKSAGMIAYGNNALECSETYHRKALELEEELGNEVEIAYSKLFLSIALVGNPERYTEGLEMAKDGLAMMQRIEEAPGIAQGLNILGELTRVGGDYDDARRYYEEGLKAAHETGEILRIAMLNENLGVISWHQGDPQSALDYLWKSLDIYTGLKNEYCIANTQGMLAGPFYSLGQLEPAVLMLASGQGMMDRIGATFQPADQVEIDQISALVRAALEEDAFEQLWALGYRMGVDEANAVVRESIG